MHLSSTPTTPFPRVSLASTFAYYAAFVALGLCVALFGPTLPNLAVNTGSTIAIISNIFIANSVGRLIGSLLCGRLLDAGLGHRIMVGGFLLIALALFATPLASSLGVLMGMLFVIGIGENLVDVASNTLLVWTHGAKAGPFMNGLHFTFGIGGILSPIIAAALIVRTGSTVAVFWLVAVAMVPAAIWLMRLPSPRRIGTSAQPSDTNTSASINWKLVVPIVMFFFALVGAEVGMMAWTFTYAVKIGFNATTTAAALASAYWAAYSFGRLLSIPISMHVSPRIVLFADLVCALASSCVFLFGHVSPVAAWVGVIGLGLSLASVFPTLLLFTGSLINVSGKVNGIMFAVSNIGAMFFPWFIGQLFEPVGPQVLSYLVLVVLMAAMASFFGVTIAARKT